MNNSVLTSITTDLEQKVAFLSQASNYPDSPQLVNTVETHMSWIFLTDNYAYKLKKPVCYDFLDFRQLSARHYYCSEEVRLNRRLAGDIYLGIVPLVFNPMGRMQLGGKGIAIDWLVKMVRLPMAHMLDYAITHSTASTDDLRTIAKHLCKFYQSTASLLIDPLSYIERFRKGIGENMNELCHPQYTLPIKMVNRICTMQYELLQSVFSQLEERVRRGKIVEGHGDLRAEHVCIKPQVAVIDCLEFSYDLRMVDPADEMSFLALECKRLGAARHGQTLLDCYYQLSGDSPTAGLVAFYQSYRATLRAKISIWHLKEERFRGSTIWSARALQYLRLAEQISQYLSVNR